MWDGLKGPEREVEYGLELHNDAVYHPLGKYFRIKIIHVAALYPVNVSPNFIDSLAFFSLSKSFKVKADFNMHAEDRTIKYY